MVGGKALVCCCDLSAFCCFKREFALIHTHLHRTIQVIMCVADSVTSLPRQILRAHTLVFWWLGSAEFALLEPHQGVCLRW
jgi:hypothetical protein